jgi:hypothetical protein
MMNRISICHRLLTFRPRKTQPYRTSTIAPVKSTPEPTSVRAGKVSRGKGDLTFFDEFVVISLPSVVCMNKPAFCLPILAKSMPGTDRFSICVCIIVELIRGLFKLGAPYCGPVISEDC